MKQTLTPPAAVVAVALVTLTCLAAVGVALAV